MDKTIPNHLAIIPDGNRRWAKEKNLPTFDGHRKGFDAAVEITRYARKLGIHTFTLWAFSTENWKRTKEEVGYLMRLYAEMIDRYLKEAIEDEVRIIHLGRADRVPDYLLKKIRNAEEKTKEFQRNILNLAFDYGGRDEILRAIKAADESDFNFNELNEENFANFLDTAGQPHPSPDLIIRTSGELRTSGLLMWQGAYSELIFLNKYFPDIKTEDIDLAVEEYSRRQRRFGK
ncbi:MAG: Isoprenyl transferase [Candidatus Levybacteria bacterium GW2011_GWB1_39_7]|nr:MAG: Isoprenyl transferase [Candidatus Levybacteria bacterium GW2011_GWB1_39_7]